MSGFKIWLCVLIGVILGFAWGVYVTLFFDLEGEWLAIPLYSLVGVGVGIFIYSLPMILEAIKIAD